MRRPKTLFIEKKETSYNNTIWYVCLQINSNAYAIISSHIGRKYAAGLIKRLREKFKSEYYKNLAPNKLASAMTRWIG